MPIVEGGFSCPGCRAWPRYAPSNGRFRHRRLLACLLSTLAAGGIPAHGLAAIACTSALQAPPAAGYLTVAGEIRVVGYNDMDELPPAPGAVVGARHPGIHFEWVLKGIRTAPEPPLDGTFAFAPLGAELEPGDINAWRRCRRSNPLRWPSRTVRRPPARCRRRRESLGMPSIRCGGSWPEAKDSRSNGADLASKERPAHAGAVSSMRLPSTQHRRNRGCRTHAGRLPLIRRHARKRR